MGKIFNHTIANIFLPISTNMCFWYSIEPSQRDGSYEYPQHCFGREIIKMIFKYTLLSGGLYKHHIKVFSVYQKSKMHYCRLEMNHAQVASLL